MSSSIQKIFLVLLVVMVVGIVLAGLLFNKAFSVWVDGQRAGNETATIQNLKTIAVVEANYFYRHQRTFGTFAELVKEEMLNSKFTANPAGIDGYVFILSVTSEPAAYTVRADPASAREGKKHFYLDSISREIHVNADKPAGPNDPVLNKQGQ